MLLGRERFGAQNIAAQRVIVNDSEVESSPEQPFDDEAGPAVDHAERDSRKLLMHTRDEGACERLAHGKRHSEIDAAAGRAGQRLHLELRPIEFAQHNPHAITEHETGIGQNDPAAVPVK